MIYLNHEITADGGVKLACLLEHLTREPSHEVLVALAYTMGIVATKMNHGDARAALESIGQMFCSMTHSDVAVSALQHTVE